MAVEFKCNDYTCPVCYPRYSVGDAVYSSLKWTVSGSSSIQPAPKKEEDVSKKAKADGVNKNIKGRYGDLQFSRTWAFEPFNVTDITNGDKIAEVHIIAENSALETPGNRYTILSAGMMTYPWYEWDELLDALEERRNFI